MIASLTSTSGIVVVVVDVVVGGAVVVVVDVMVVTGAKVVVGMVSAGSDDVHAVISSADATNTPRTLGRVRMAMRIGARPLNSVHWQGWSSG